MSHIVSVPAMAAPDAGSDVGKQTSLVLARLDGARVELMTLAERG